MKRSLILAMTLVLAVVLLSVPALAGDNTGKLNLNKATVEQLEQLPDMTPEIAKGIVELREQNGEFVDMEELLDVDGVTPALLRKLDRFLFIEPVSDCNC